MGEVGVARAAPRGIRKHWVGCGRGARLRAGRLAGWRVAGGRTHIARGQAQGPRAMRRSAVCRHREATIANFRRERGQTACISERNAVLAGLSVSLSVLALVLAALSVLAPVLAAQLIQELIQLFPYI